MKNDEKGNEKCKPGSCKNHNCKKRCLKEAIINNLKVERKWRKHANQTRDHNWTNMISKKYEKMQKSRSALCFCTCIFFFPFLISIFCFTWCISPRLHFLKFSRGNPQSANTILYAVVRASVTIKPALTILTPRPARKLADADAWQRLMVKDGQGDAIQPAFANEN